MEQALKDARGEARASATKILAERPAGWLNRVSFRLLHAGSWLIGGAVLVAIVLFFRHYLAGTGQADQLTATWKTLEPKYTKAKEREDVLRSARNRLSELKGWSATRYSIPDLLEQLAPLIPPGMQLISLELQGFLAGVEGDVGDVA